MICDKITLGLGSTTGVKNYRHSRKRTVFDWLTLCKDCTTLYRTLIYTVHYCILLYVSTDLYCTVLNNTVRSYWHAQYNTEKSCTFWPTRTVQYWTTLYRILTCTVHYWTVQNGYNDKHYTQLNIMEQGYRHTLYLTRFRHFFKNK